MSAMKQSTTVFVHAVVRTMAPGSPVAEALAIREGRVLAVGDEASVRSAAGPDARIVDLGGAAVVPGFVDAHHHLGAAVIGAFAIDTSPKAVRSIDDIVAAVRDAGRTTAPGDWILASGYDEHSLAEARHPTRDDLDAAGVPNPVLLMHYSHHEGAVNSRALEVLGIDRHTADPRGGLIGRRPDGEPDGRLVETATALPRKLAEDSLVARDEDAVLQRMVAYERRLLAVGITRVCDPTVTLEMELVYRRARKEGLLTLPVVMMPIGSRGALVPPWDRVDGPPTGEGPEDLRRGPLKLFLDGGNRCALCMTAGQALRVTLGMVGRALSQRSMAMLRTSKDVKPRWGGDGKLRTGVQYMTREEASRLVGSACDRGFSVAVHALGNDAVARALAAFADARGRHRDVPPPRIEHASLITRDLTLRAADLGVTIVTQPQFVELPIFDRMPKIPGMRSLAHRTFLDAGVAVAGSSDAPVTGFDPLDGMRAAVFRRTLQGTVLQPEEAVTPAEALAMYTREAARAAGCLDVTGTLEPGKRADLVILSEDPTVSKEALERARVVETVLAGRTVHAAAPRRTATARSAETRPAVTAATQ